MEALFRSVCIVDPSSDSKPIKRAAENARRESLVRFVKHLIWTPVEYVPTNGTYSYDRYRKIGKSSTRSQIRLISGLQNLERISFEGNWQRYHVAPFLAKLNRMPRYIGFGPMEYDLRFEQSLLVDVTVTLTRSWTETECALYRPKGPERILTKFLGSRGPFLPHLVGPHGLNIMSLQTGEFPLLLAI